jgi:hypothetical protein
MYNNSMGMRAGATFANAFDRGRGISEKPDYSTADMMLAESNKPVQDVLNKQVLQSEKMNTALKASDFMDNAQLQDPKSQLSQAFRGVAARLNPTIAQDPNFQNMSAQTLKMAEPMVDSAGRLMYYQSLKQDQIARQQDKLYSQNASKATNDIENLMSRRGPVGNAEQISQSADRLLTLLNSGRKLTQQDMATAANDLDAIYRGGTSTISGAQKILPDTLGTRIAGASQFLSGNPTSADLEQFQERYKQMAKEVKQVANQYKLQHISNSLEGHRRGLDPSDYETLKNRYVNPIQQDLQDATPKVAPHPEDSAALQWAKANPDDPRSAAIMKLNGAQ